MTRADEVAAETAPPAFPPKREDPFAFPSLYSEAREQPGLTTVHMTWMDRDVSLVSRYDDVQAVLNNELTTVDYRLPDFPVMEPYRQYRPEAGHAPLLHVDAPRHGELRRVITPALTVKRVKQMEPAITEIIEQVLDEMIAGGNTAELQSQLIFRVHGGAVTVLFGMPPEDANKLTELALSQLHAAHEGKFDMASAIQVAQHVAQHMESTTDPTPLVASLHAARERDDIDTAQMISLANTVYVGGFETTASVLGSSIFELLRRPEDAAYFRDADPKQTMVAVNELLRYTTVDHFGLGRMSRGEIPLGDGTVVPDGERLIVSLVGANHDEKYFTNPDVLDLKRTDNPLLTFGFGPHQCPGQQLARAEIVGVIKALFRRLPTLRLAVDPADVVFNETSELRGPIELPVTW